MGLAKLIVEYDDDSSSILINNKAGEWEWFTNPGKKRITATDVQAYTLIKNLADELAQQVSTKRKERGMQFDVSV